MVLIDDIVGHIILLRIDEVKRPKCIGHKLLDAQGLTFCGTYCFDLLQKRGDNQKKRQATTSQLKQLFDKQDFTLLTMFAYYQEYTNKLSPGRDVGHTHLFFYNIHSYSVGRTMSEWVKSSSSTTKVHQFENYAGCIVLSLANKVRQVDFYSPCIKLNPAIEAGQVDFYSPCMKLNFL